MYIISWNFHHWSSLGGITVSALTEGVNWGSEYSWETRSRSHSSPVAGLVSAYFSKHLISPKPLELWWGLTREFLKSMLGATKRMDSTSSKSEPQNFHMTQKPTPWYMLNRSKNKAPTHTCPQIFISSTIHNKPKVKISQMRVVR